MPSNNLKCNTHFGLVVMQKQQQQKTMWLNAIEAKTIHFDLLKLVYCRNGQMPKQWKSRQICVTGSILDKCIFGRKNKKHDVKKWLAHCMHHQIEYNETKWNDKIYGVIDIFEPDTPHMHASIVQFRCSVLKIRYGVWW